MVVAERNTGPSDPDFAFVTEANGLSLCVDDEELRVLDRLADRNGVARRDARHRVHARLRRHFRRAIKVEELRVGQLLQELKRELIGEAFASDEPKLQRAESARSRPLCVEQRAKRRGDQEHLSDPAALELGGEQHGIRRGLLADDEGPRTAGEGRKDLTDRIDEAERSLRAATLAPAAKGNSRRNHSMRFTTPRCDTRTPFGRPVDPDV